HIPGHYFEVSDEVNLAKGLSLGPSLPRFSSGYGDVRHLPTLFVETHSLKPYRQRVLGTYILLEASLRTLGLEGRALQRAVAEDVAAQPASVPLNVGNSAAKGTTMDFLGVDSE